MPCNNLCCPPHNMTADRDPTVDDCSDSVVEGYTGGYCPGSYWYNEDSGELFIGANDMACQTARWVKLNTAEKMRFKSTWNSTNPQGDDVGYPNSIANDIVNGQVEGIQWYKSGNNTDGKSIFLPGFSVVNFDNKLVQNGNYRITIPNDGYYTFIVQARFSPNGFPNISNHIHNSFGIYIDNILYDFNMEDRTLEELSIIGDFVINASNTYQLTQGTVVSHYLSVQYITEIINANGHWRFGGTQFVALEL